jgi:hypothetical protein
MTELDKEVHDSSDLNFDKNFLENFKKNLFVSTFRLVNGAPFRVILRLAKWQSNLIK